MAQAKISERDWQVFLGVADQLGIDLCGLPKEGVRFTVLEEAAHRLGRAVAQATTERLALTRAQQITGPQPCPTCGLLCPLVHEERSLETIDGPIGLCEAKCHCPACRRDFFPSASRIGARPTEL